MTGAINSSQWTWAKRQLIAMVVHWNQQQLRHLYGTLTCSSNGAATKRASANLTDTSLVMLEHIYSTYDVRVPPGQTMEMVADDIKAALQAWWYIPYAEDVDEHGAHQGDAEHEDGQEEEHEEYEEEDDAAVELVEDEQQEYDDNDEYGGWI